jgi:hypothetical protein
MVLVIQIALGILLGYILIVNFRTFVRYAGILLLVSVVVIGGIILKDELLLAANNIVLIIVIVGGGAGAIVLMGYVLEYTPYLKKFSIKELKKWPEYDGDWKDYLGDRMANGIRLMLMALAIYIGIALAYLMVAEIWKTLIYI